MASTLTVSYELEPPSNTSAEGLETKKTHHYTATAKQSGKKYYDELRKAVAEAKSVLGEELTAWRDAVGTREQTKESKIPNSGGEENDEEVDGEEQD